MKIRMCLAFLCAAGISFAGKTASIKIGDAEIIALQDREHDMPNKLFNGAPPEDIKAAVPSGQSPASINAFVIKTVEHVKDAANKNKPPKIVKRIYLIDSGMGSETLLKNLQEVGIKAEDVNVVLITHMHYDHIGGLLHEGKATFPNATLHIAKDEYNYWMQANPNIKKLGNAYRTHIELFTYGEDLPIVRIELSDLEKNVALTRKKETTRVIEMTDYTFQGLSAVGHTPGHTVYENNKMMIIGDLVHSAALQFADPNICAQFDMDTKKAIESRKKFFDRAAETKKIVMGAHLPFPGIGYIVKDEADRFSFEPLKMTP